MKVIIYGAGAIGSAVGAMLKLAGHEAVLIGRPGHVKAINEHGLKFNTPNTSQCVKIPAVANIKEINIAPDDVIVLSVKGQNTEEALNDIHKYTKDIPVFCFQNGVLNEEAASKIFPRVYGVTVFIDSGYLSDGEVTNRRESPRGALIMGRYPKGTDKVVETLAAQLRDADLLILVTPDIMPFKWGKFVMNLGNAISGITNAREEEIAFIGRAAREELQRLLEQTGVHPLTAPEMLEKFPDLSKISMGKGNKPPSEGGGSTWQSLSRGAGTVETDFLNGAVVRLARKLGCEAPVNEGIVRVCTEMAAKKEKPGRYTPVELGKLLGL